MIVNREELAWAAGFFDGEGTTGVKTGKRPAPQAHLSQTDKRPLERFQKAVFGCGIILGPYSRPQYPNRKPYWTWSVQNFEEVQAVVAALWTFLSEPKRDQARIALATWLARPHRDTAVLTARRAYKRDWYRKTHGVVRHQSHEDRVARRLTAARILI